MVRICEIRKLTQRSITNGHLVVTFCPACGHSENATVCCKLSPGCGAAHDDARVPGADAGHAALLDGALLAARAAGPHAEEPGGVRVAVQGQGLARCVDNVVNVM